jgi:hypothetical protein
MNTTVQTDNATKGTTATVVSQPAPWGGSESWAACECGWRGRNHTRRADADAEATAHRCGPVGLDNQGTPVHGDKVPYAAARRDLFGGGGL